MPLEQTQGGDCEVLLTWTDKTVPHEVKGQPHVIGSLWDALITANRSFQYPRYNHMRGRLIRDGCQVDGADGDLGREDLRRLSPADAASLA